MKITKMGPVALACLGGLVAGAQTAPPAATAPAPQPQAAAQSDVARFNLAAQQLSGKLSRIEKSGNVLAEMQGLQALEAEYAGNDMTLDVIRTILAQQVMPRLGDYAGAHHYGDLGGPPWKSLPSPSGPDGYSPIGALQAIEAAAGTRQVVMINEAHHVPQHRAFTLQLLAALRRKGFTYFAAETLSPDPGLAQRGYPTPETGAYIQEPLYGDLVRTALRLGYQVVPYEADSGFQPGGGIELREREQARHLVERIFQKDPKAKVLVHAGYSHILKAASSPGSKWMAAYFKESTGIDPLTVNQEIMTEHSAPEFEHPLYRWAVERGMVAEPMVLGSAAGAFWSPSPAIDVVVFHPRSRYENGRPTWLRMGGLRSPLPLAAGICFLAPRCLVQARPVKEGTDAVPIDQIVAEAGKPAPALMLPEGEFVVRVEDAQGKLISEQREKVSRPPA
ncbi:MAG TPA: hypothetical protein VGS07_06000 [Thermoanaerobaculia bacterium]|nr:hypothetical protein [Thermoanaerobaculia bacterium]